MLPRAIIFCFLASFGFGVRAQTFTLISPGYFDSAGINVLAAAVLLPVGIAGDLPLPGAGVAVGVVTDVFGSGGPIDGLALASQDFTTRGGPSEQGLGVVYEVFGADGLSHLLLSQSPLPLPLFEKTVLDAVGLDQMISVGAFTAPLSGLPNLNSLPELPGL